MVTLLELVHEVGLAVGIPPQGEDVAAGFRDQQRLFELGREEAVGGDGGPVVRPGHVPPRSLRNHRLDGEAVARFHHADGVVFCGWESGKILISRASVCIVMKQTKTDLSLLGITLIILL